MARNISGVLVRQLLGSRKNPCPCAGLLHHRKLLSSSTGTLTLTSPKTIIPSTSKPFSLHSPNFHCLQLRRLSFCSRRLGLKLHPPGVPRLCLVDMYYEMLKKVEDERLSAVFFFTDSWTCWKSKKFIGPVYAELCKQYLQYTAIYTVDLRKNGLEGTLHGLKIDHTPTFRFYVNGQMVYEFEGASGRRLKKALEVIYNPPGLRKMRAALQAKKEENDRLELAGPCEGAVQVAACKFPATSFHGVMKVVESLPGGAPDSDMWWFARGLFHSQKTRDRFCNLEHPHLKLEWLKQEMADDE